jgi:uncharacterized protein YdeI (YjbR/CyaY-like superfamily)
MPEDLRRVFENDAQAAADWEALSDRQKQEWLVYIAEGREPARRDVRIANLLMGIAA